MCNAWNHPASCDCGFGGDTGFGGGVGALKRAPMGSYESYVNPNARCPVCRSDVFFFQASNGGRVFFDELGPPWPKHACTDSSQKPTVFHSTDSSRKPRVFHSFEGLMPKPKWATDGWKPFKDMETYPRDTYQCFSGWVIGESYLTLFALRRGFWWLQSWDNYPVFVRKVFGPEYEVATFILTLKDEYREVLFRASSTFGAGRACKNRFI
jgi:hypothetical protein